MKNVTYIEHKTLRMRGPVESEPDSTVDGILLVGDEPVLVYESGHQRAGHDLCELHPAVHNGSRAWLLRRSWRPANGYCAYGTQDSILDFATGVGLFLERGVFAFPVA